MGTKHVEPACGWACRSDSFYLRQKGEKLANSTRPLGLVDKSGLLPHLVPKAAFLDIESPLLAPDLRTSKFITVMNVLAPGTISSMLIVLTR